MNLQSSEAVVLDVGSGPKEINRLPAYFSSWRRLRIDVDPQVEPDFVAELTSLSPIPDASVDAVWASHCVEHLYLHDVFTAISEFRRVLNANGFVCVIVPDLQAIGSFLVADRLNETVYVSEAGPISAHDMLFGFGPSVAQGHLAMAHKCGFTPTALKNALVQHAFGEVFIRRRVQSMELVALARVEPAASDEERLSLVTALEL